MKATEIIVAACRSVYAGLRGGGSVRVGGASALKAGKLARGIWRPRGLAPVAVADPEKLLAISRPVLTLPTPSLSRLFAKGTLADKWASRLVSVLHRLGDVAALRELERLFSGGGELWSLEYENLVVNEGLDHLLDVALSGGAQDTTWFIGLLGSSPTPAATWTDEDLAAVDFVGYDEAALQAFTDGGVSGQSVDNSGSPATFTITSDASTVGGAFLIGTNAKATPAGLLYAAGAFTGGNKTLGANDTLEVTATFETADGG